jgi:hypothetical protein
MMHNPRRHYLTFGSGAVDCCCYQFFHRPDNFWRWCILKLFNGNPSFNGAALGGVLI